MRKLLLLIVCLMAMQYGWAQDQSPENTTSEEFTGIGAALMSHNGQTIVTDIIQGSASWRQGELEPHDIILKIGQDGGEPIGIEGMELDDVIQMIRGKIGTQVSLTVKKQDGTIKVITITRDKVAVAKEQPEIQSLRNSSTQVRKYCESIIDGTYRTSPIFNIQSYLDTVRHILSTHTVPLKESDEVYAKLSLRWYAIMNPKDSIRNYDELDTLLSKSLKHWELIDRCFFECSNTSGRYYYKKKEYAKAYISYYKAVLSIPFVFQDTLCHETDNSYYYMSRLCELYGEYGKAAHYRECHVLSDKKYMVSLSSFTTDESETNKELAKITAESAKLELELLSSSMATDYVKLAELYSKAGNRRKADSCFHLYESHINSNIKSKEEKAETFSSIAFTLEEAGFYPEAIEAYRKANLYEKRLPDYIDNILAIANLQIDLGDTAATNTINELVSLAVKYHKGMGIDELIHIETICTNEYAGTEQQRDQIIALLDKKSEGGSSLLALTAKIIVSTYRGNYMLANRYAKQAIKMIDKDITKVTTEELVFISGILNQVGVGYSYDTQKTYEKVILERYKEIAPKDIYIEALYLYTSIDLLTSGSTERASVLADSLMSIKQNADSSYYYWGLELKAQVAEYQAQYYYSADLWNKIKNHEKHLIKKFEYASKQAFSYFAQIDILNSNFDSKSNVKPPIAEFEKVVDELFEIGGDFFPKQSESYCQMLFYKASLMHFKGDKNAMMEVVYEIEQIANKTVATDLRQERMDMVATFYAINGEYDKALKLMSVDRTKTNLQLTNDVTYGSFLFLAELYYLSGNENKARENYRQLVDIITNGVSKNFPTLTVSERSTYWNMFKQAFYDAGKYATVYGKENEFNSTLYDLALYSKGLLMRSQNAIAAKIESLGDTALTEKFALIKQLRMAVANGKNSGYDVSNYERDAEKFEKELLQACAQKGYTIESEFPNYERVKSKLSAKDAAVEFVLYFDKDTVGHYGALVLRNNYKYPIFVHISEKESLENSLSFDTKTTQTIWNPLLPYFNGIENVYFSPIGKIHKFAIEYLPFNDTEMIADKYNLFRVSSTAELVKRNSTTSFNYTKAVIYGGIYYDTDTITMREVVTDQTRENSGNGVLCYLKGTLKEAQTISSVFKNSHIQVELFDDWSATEESFKRLSGKDNDVIHIGTHGFCKVTDNDLRLAISGSNSQVDGDYAMNNSGLYFSGANNALRGYRAYGLEDGVLTAKEISSLDFSKTDLITLSACVTGDGDITGEGVFGVQRGFKLARANSLLMSCWSVDDNATNLLMSEFYTNLTKGMTKRKSLLEAVKIVKAKYTSPHKWAAFVLLDGLN